MYRNKNTHKGFTLIEIMVSLSIFAIVMVVALGTLLVLVRASAVAQASQEVTNNLSFALDSMTRDIRTGYSYYCDNNADPETQNGSEVNDCSGERGLVFTDGGSGDRFGYRLNTTENTIEKKVEDGSWIPVTSAAITIDRFEFHVTGTTRSDTEQPTIRILVSGIAGQSSDLIAEFDIQTTVVARSIDF